MVAYNFQKRFAPAILSGEKTHTIRRNGKRRHARKGEKLQLYTGMRTAACVKIIPDPTCQFTVPVTIEVAPEVISLILLGTHVIDDLESFAIADGFTSAADMHSFWLEFHGVGLFVGSYIEWGES